MSFTDNLGNDLTDLKGNKVKGSISEIISIYQRHGGNI